jgi:hypothetical protein
MTEGKRKSLEVRIPVGARRPHFAKKTSRLIERLNRDGDHCHTGVHMRITI